MAQKDFLFNHHIVKGKTPVADAFAGGVTADVICLRDYRKVTFLIDTGAIEDTGVSNTVTVKACTTAAAGGATTMAFSYRTNPGTTADDTWSALTAAAAAGFSLTKAANYMYAIEVTAEEVAAAVENADFVQLNIAEDANKTITAGVIAILSEPRYEGAVPQTAIA